MICVSAWDRRTWTALAGFNGMRARAGVAFHVADDEVPAGACEKGADPPPTKERRRNPW